MDRYRIGRVVRIEEERGPSIGICSSVGIGILS